MGATLNVVHEKFPLPSWRCKPCGPNWHLRWHWGTHVRPYESQPTPGRPRARENRRLGMRKDPNTHRVDWETTRSHGSRSSNIWFEGSNGSCNASFGGRAEKELR